MNTYLIGGNEYNMPKEVEADFIELSDMRPSITLHKYKNGKNFCDGTEMVAAIPIDIPVVLAKAQIEPKFEELS